MTKEPVGFDIRYTFPEDAAHLRSWLLTPGMLHRFPISADQEKELDDSVNCWVGFCRWKSSLTAMIDDKPCGMGTLFLMPYRKVAHHCLFKLIVAPEHQRKGVGSSLLRNLKHLALNYFHLDLMHIEVFEDNEPLLSLLAQNDFHEFARQARFVKEGDQYYGRILLESYLK